MKRYNPLILYNVACNRCLVCDCECNIHNDYNYMNPDGIECNVLGHKIFGRICPILKYTIFSKANSVSVVYKQFTKRTLKNKRR